jgi:hypothetical protein
MHGVSLAGSVCQPILPVLKSCYERLGKGTISKEKQGVRIGKSGSSGHGDRWVR